MTQYSQRLHVIQDSIELWCMDEAIPDEEREELTPSLEAIYNIAIGACDGGLDNMLADNKIKRDYYEKAPITKEAK